MVISVLQLQCKILSPELGICKPPVSLKFEYMKVKEAINHILGLMEKQLPTNLFYHSVYHVSDVMESAKQLAGMENLTNYEKDLLFTAVAYHDSGFLYQVKEHEARGCEIVREWLPEYGFNTEEINRICGMIMATRIPQTPHNLLEEIICDADLDYLGRNDFWTIGNKLFMELTDMGILKSEEEWNKLQLSFLTNHQYFTESAIRIRNDMKLEHLKKIDDIVKSYQHG